MLFHAVFPDKGSSWKNSKNILVYLIKCMPKALKQSLIKNVPYSGESDHDFPDVVSIWNKDPDASIWSAQKACLGQYSKMPGKSSRGRPVYKNIDRKDRFFFVGANGFWYCSYTYGPTAGGFLAAVKTKGAPRWTRYSFGPKSFIIEGMSIEDMVPVFMKHPIFRIK